MSFSQQYAVRGMTCDHCVIAVTEEISALEGVIGVDIELVVNGNSRVTVASEHPLDTNIVRAAVDEAGYEISD
jgi:copper chaperone CopZ